MTDTFLQAQRYQHYSGQREIRFIVIHDEEYPEGINSAEAIAHMFHTTSQPKSAHFVHDANSTVQCVLENDIAYHAPPNGFSIGHEHDGYARQTRDQWLDDASKASLERSAKMVAGQCIRYGLPVRKIGPSELLAGEKGICGHADVSEAWHQTTHTDPGTDFPWDYYLSRVEFYYNAPSNLKEASVAINGHAVEFIYTPSGKGYWIFASDGGVFCKGDAGFDGSEGGHKLNAPVVTAELTPTHLGYWLFAADGGVLCEGDAQFYGSLGDMKLNAPIVNAALTPSGKGYAMIDALGEVYCNGKDGKSFGDAKYFGNAV